MIFMRLLFTIHVFITIIVGCVFPAQTMARSWEEPNVARKYNLYYGGLRTGYMLAEIRKQKNGVYRFEVRIKSTGILHWITKYRSTTVATFKVNKHGTVIPLHFFSDGKLRKRKRSTMLEYDASGDLIKEVITPPKKPGKRKDVPATLRAGALDPLTTAFFSREFIKQFAERSDKKNDHFSVKTYDGKRLGDYEFTIRGHKKMQLHKKKFDTIEMSFIRKPIMGFSKKEMKRLKKEPIIHVFFQNDSALLPVRAEGNIPYGTAVVIYDHDCVSIEQC